MTRWWPWINAALVALAAVGLGILLGTALRTQFLFFPEPITGPTASLLTLLANLLFLVPVLAVLLSAALTRRLGWQRLALAFLAPLFVSFAVVTLVAYSEVSLFL